MFNAAREFDYELHYQANGEEDDASRRKDYRRNRTFRPTRRRAKKATASHPGFGMAGRRNRRWAW